MSSGVCLPTDEEVAHVAVRVHRRVARRMEKRGLGSQADPDESDGLRRDEPLLAELYGASVSGRVATGPRTGMPASASLLETVCAWNAWRVMPAVLHWQRSGCHSCPTAGYSIDSSTVGATEPRT